MSDKAKGGIVLVVILMVVAVILVHLIDNPSTTSSSAQHVVIGEQGFLRTSGASSTIVGISENAYDAFFKAASANDAAEYSQLQQSGQVFSVDNGAKVLVVDSRGGYDQVRFLEGKYAGQSAWVEYEMVSAN